MSEQRNKKRPADPSHGQRQTRQRTNTRRQEEPSPIPPSPPLHTSTPVSNNSPERHHTPDTLLIEDDLGPNCTPRKVRLLETLRSIQHEKDKLHDQVIELKQAIAIHSTEAPVTSNQSPLAEELADNEIMDIRHAAGSFVATCAFWIPNKIFKTELTSDYNSIDRYGNEESRLEGLRRDIDDILESRFGFTREFIQRTIVQTMFFTSITYHHTTCGQRVRKTAADIIFDCSSADLATEESRKQFTHRIGFDVAKGRYDAWNVPVLHKDHNQKLNLTTIFMSSSMLRVFATLAFGKESAIRLKTSNDKSIQPLTRGSLNNEHWRLSRTEPGMIAMSAILVRYGLSIDSELREVGNKTGINYRRDYESYMKYLEDGLRAERRSVRELFRKWDAIFFPDADSHGRRTQGEEREREESNRRAMELLAADEIEGASHED